MNKKTNRLSAIFSFRKITALFISAVFLLTLLSACTQNSGGSSAKITEDEAKKIALEDCGLQESEIRNKTIALDTENGILVYEFDIDANTGKIIGKSKEALDNPLPKATADNTAPPEYESTSEAVTGGPAQVPQTITLEQAKAIALSDAGVSESSVKFTKEKQDTENGITVYDFEFYTNTKEYEYEIGLQGNIVKREVNSYNNSSASAPTQYISADEALEKALADAKLIRSQVTVVIDFYKDSTEYEYEIDAVSGSILKKETKNHGSVASSQKITSEEALSKALADAGLSRSQVTVVKTEYDREDNKYEIEFYSSSTEYEYEIDAASGRILKRETDSHSGHHHSHHNCY